MKTTSTITENIDLEKPLFQCTIGDLKALLSDLYVNNSQAVPEKTTKHYVYGLAGLAKLLGCSQPTAQRIKSSGVLDDAISQIGGLIIVDAEYAIDLLKISKKYRKSPLLKKKQLCKDN